MALPDDREYRATTADDLHKIFDCWVRLEVLIALAGDRGRPAHTVARALGISPQLFNAHTTSLQDLGIIRGERLGTSRVFEPTSKATVNVGPAGVTIDVASDDGARMSMFIPEGSPAMRMIASGLRARRAAVIEVLPLEPRPAPRGRTSQSAHRPNAP